MISPEQPRSSSQSRALRPAPAAYEDAFPASRSDSHPSPPQTPLEISSDFTKLRAAHDLTHDSIHQDGSPRLLGGGRFLRDPLRPGSRSPSQSPFRLTMPGISPAQLAFSAMQYLPVPTMVLNNLKTVVLANEAMGRMLGIVTEEADEEDASATIERLRGQTLSQVGIDMLQDGRPVWMTWEAFLNSLVEEISVRASTKNSQQQSQVAGDATPTTCGMPIPDRCESTGSRQNQNAIVEVVISRKGITRAALDDRYKTKASEYHVFASMIITIWELEDRQTFFTLTFTSTQSPPSSFAPTRRSVARPSILEAAERRSISQSNPSSVSSSRDSNSPSFHNPGIVTMSSNPFPPMGPPSVASQSSTPSILQKMLLMKDALLNNTQMPILAMWKDGSVTIPNQAARKLLRKDAPFDASLDGFELLRYWEMYTEDYSRKLTVDEYPISLLLKNEQPFASLRVGMYDDQGKKVVYDVLGEAIRDDTTGEFLAGVITGRDVTMMTEEIEQIKERDEERFKLVCDTMPQLVWTTKPDGYADFFNTHWYSYTGLSTEQSYGRAWLSALHPDDWSETIETWEHSLATGDPFVIEYRCRGKNGEYRWFLGRASPLRNKETGEIEKWFGTCTDAHEGISSKRNAKQTRQQLLSVIAHSHVTLFTVDPKRRVTMLEGALIWNNIHDETGCHEDTRWFIGENMYTVFNRLTSQLADGERPAFLEPIEQILDGKANEDVHEHGIDDRWYRTRFLPMVGKKTQEGKATNSIEGVIGVIMDVTELKVREEALLKQSKERRKAIANEAAAKEANRLKSQFLANMSHEIRTPITGVLGMAELLAGMELNSEQQEYVENIQSSATSLLTVINDILDFSKVESGRLDIEEVQFSLSHIVKEVGRMLKFAVERKNLDFQSDIDRGIENNLVVIGDPGRVRQIITNLLTNSIKFTNEGHVRFSVAKEKETAESIEIRFTIEDTGIGIQEDVRKRLFQPFSQGDSSTARRFGGTGLGLTICKNLLDLMRGRITLESNVGNGTSATFWIPFNKPNGPAEASLAQAGAIPDRLQSELSMSCNSSEYEQRSGTPPVSESAHGAQMSLPRRSRSILTPSSPDQDLPPSERAKIRILVVEDNPINQKIATKTIGKLGFQVTAAWNGKEALDYLLGASKGINPKPDIILMDVQMPIIDGYKCTHLLRHHLPYKTFVHDVPIVAMTASAIQGDREKCTKAGMDDYLAKPVRGVILEKMLIRWCLARRRDSPPSDPSSSDCSERISGHCSNADIPHIGIDQADMPPLTPFIDDNLVTPRPLVTNGQQIEPSPFNSPATELATEVRRAEGEQELTNHLQETKLFDAAGGPTTYRSNSYQKQQGGDSLTEENVNKLRSENQPLHR